MRLATIALLLTVSFSSYAQVPQNEHWVFGVQTGVQFTEDGPVTISTGIDCGFERTPATISNANGELLYYADETNVYDNLGFPLSNGNYGSNCDESIFIPDPGNSSRIYHIRTFYSGGDLEYSIIDLNENDVIEQSTEFFNIGGHINASLKPDGTGYWLISADNNNGDNQCFIRVFDVNAEGITFHSEYTTSWTWIGWYPELDDAVLSPDCSRLAVSFKAHYIGLFAFDNEIGEITDALNNSVDNGGFVSNYAEMAFSPSSQYLYTIATNTAEVKQFDISSFNASIISGSQTVVGTNNQQSWSDIKLGPDGEIYLYNNATEFLDVIENPDLPGNELDVTTGAVSVPGAVTTYFPETTNFACGQLLFFDPQTIDVCLGDETQFELLYSIEPDSVLWNFGDPEGGDLNMSMEESPVYLYDEIGSYDVDLTIWFDEDTLEFDLIAQVFDYPEFDLGSDIIACADDLPVLAAGDADTYDWNTGDDTQEIVAESSGLYFVTAANGICPTTDSINVEIIPFLNVSLGPDLVLCDPDPVTLDANQLADWNTGEDAESILVEESGTYIATVSNSCFTDSDSVLVNYVIIPEVDLPEESFICRGDSLELALSFSADNIVWTSSIETFEEDVIYADETDEYVVSFFYEGCPGSASTFVEVLNSVDLDQVVMPNIFSPNGDQTNNEFRPIILNEPNLNPCSLSLLEVDLRVYNRWGGVMSEGGCNWTGSTPNGDDASEGVYYYIVDLSSACSGSSDQKEITGDITLKR